MREFLGALMLCLVTAGLAYAIAPYRDPAEQVYSLPLCKTAETAPLKPIVLASLPPSAPSSEEIDLTRELRFELDRGIAFVKIAQVQPQSRQEDRGLALLAKARHYLGTNPTGWRNLWCAKFIAMLAPDLAKRVDNPNWARDWAVLPKAKPKPGVIVVLKRGNGGHIGILARFDRRGNPVIISGNHGHRVAEGVYSKSRVIAYVSASG